MTTAGGSSMAALEAKGPIENQYKREIVFPLAGSRIQARIASHKGQVALCFTEARLFRLLRFLKGLCPMPACVDEDALLEVP